MWLKIIGALVALFVIMVAVGVVGVGLYSKTHPAWNPFL